jgi:hypothetical protein
MVEVLVGFSRMNLVTFVVSSPSIIEKTVLDVDIAASHLPFAGN